MRHVTTAPRAWNRSGSASSGYGFGGRLIPRPAAGGCSGVRVPRRGDVVGRATGAGRAGSIRTPRSSAHWRTWRRPVPRRWPISTPAATHTELTDAGPRPGSGGGLRQAVRARRRGRPRFGGAAPNGSAWPLAPYQNRRWDSDFRTVRALAERGALGTRAPVRVALRAVRPRARPACRRAAARCSTSAATWSTRRWSCSARSRRCTPSGGCGRAAWTTTSSSR